MSNCSTDNNKHERCAQGCGCAPAGGLTPLHAHNQTCACSESTPATEAPADGDESGCGCSSCGCHSHAPDHGSGDDKRELLLMGVSAVLFAIGMLADTRMPSMSPVGWS